MTATPHWVCPGCNRALSTAYCPSCGEKPPQPHDLTLRGVLEKLAHALTNIDGRVLRSFRCLLGHPGRLTWAYAQGQRVQYVAPFQLFLIANVVFFAVQSVTSTSVFSPTLDSHLHHQDWSAWAQQLVARRLEAKHTTLDRYAPLFDQSVVLHAKSLIVLMVLPFALVLPVVFLRNRQPVMTHVAFSLHFYAFMLLVFCVSLAASAVDTLTGGPGLASARMDNVLSVINLAAGAAYLYAAAGTVYGVSGLARFVGVAALAMAAAAIVLGYRFALLPITLYTT